MDTERSMDRTERNPTCNSGDGNMFIGAESQARTLFAEPTVPGGGNKVREIRVKELNKGYIVDVGCHTFAISTSAELIAKLSQYINEPSKTEEKWFKGELF